MVGIQILGLHKSHLIAFAADVAAFCNEFQLFVAILGLVPIGRNLFPTFSENVFGIRQIIRNNPLCCNTIAQRLFARVDSIGFSEFAA